MVFRVTFAIGLRARDGFNDDASRFNQGILRTALGLKVRDVRLWLGYGYIPSDPIGVDDVIEEHRIFQQLTYGGRFENSDWAYSIRTRLEQRNVETGDDLGHRFRQFVKVSYHGFDPNSPWYLSFWDEVFVNINDTDWGADSGVDQNRLFIGIGRRVSQSTNVEVGYLNQFLPRDDRDDGLNHIISISVFINL